MDLHVAAAKQLEALSTVELHRLVAQLEDNMSRVVLGKALSHPAVAKLPSVVSRPDPIEWLADEISVSFVGELLYIGLEGNDPAEVVKLVNAVTDAYLEEVVNADKRRREQRLAKLRSQYRAQWDSHQIIADQNTRLTQAGKQPTDEQLIREQRAADALALARDELTAAMSRLEVSFAGPECSTE